VEGGVDGKRGAGQAIIKKKHPDVKKELNQDSRERGGSKNYTNIPQKKKRVIGLQQRVAEVP